jgi:hypothetical protein
MIDFSFLELGGKRSYYGYFRKNFCGGAIETADGIPIFFEKRQFWHAFFESTNRDGEKDSFSLSRAERMNWILGTLQDSGAMCYQGWDRKRKKADPTRQVRTSGGDFVVVLKFFKGRGGELRGIFVTCYVADNSMGKIRGAPLWDKELCVRLLGVKGDEGG